MDHTFIRPVISEEAALWIDGSVEPSAYFAMARDIATARARAEVSRRLRDHRTALSWSWSAVGERRPTRRGGSGRR